LSLRALVGPGEIRELCHKSNRMEATLLLDNVILNVRAAQNAELIRWGNTLKYRKESILRHLCDRATDSFAEAPHTRMKIPKEIS